MRNCATWSGDIRDTIEEFGFTVKIRTNNSLNNQNISSDTLKHPLKKLYPNLRAIIYQSFPLPQSIYGNLVRSSVRCIE